MDRFAPVSYVYIDVSYMISFLFEVSLSWIESEGLPKICACLKLVFEKRTS